MRELRQQTWMSRSLKAAATVFFAGYCAWNIFWVSNGRFPPSIWSYCTGWPCPSSGVSRSLAALLSWDLGNFMRYNPFSLPFLALFLVSLACIVLNWRVDRRFSMPTLLGRLWFAMLGLAWIAKFMLGKEYW